MNCRFCTAELKCPDNWFPSQVGKSDFSCKDCRRVLSRASMRRYLAKKRGEAVPKKPKLTRAERLERHRLQMAEFRVMNRERLAQDRAIRREAMRDPAVQAALKAAIERLNDRPL